MPAKFTLRSATFLAQKEVPPQAYATRWLAAMLLCWLVLPLTGPSIAQGENQQPPPNVLFLLTDDQRTDTIAALGNPGMKTPHLDQLVQRGFIFHNAYCMGSTMPAVCNPSRHMIQSGMSLYRYRPQPEEATPSLARAFRQAGYETYHHSKRGNTALAYHKHYEHSHYLDDMAERNSGHHGRTAGNDAVEFLNQRDRSRPFLMYVGFAGPHDPRVAAEEWMKHHPLDQISLPGNHAPFHPFDNGELLVRDELLAPWPRTEEVVRQHLRDYHACITSIDHHIGRILAELQAQSDLDNTIILFSSDHGLAIGSHGLFGKQSLYEHSMRAPMIIAGPGVPQGETQALMYLHDIFPTLCDLAGLPVPQGLDGVSQKPVILDQQPTCRKSIYLAYREVQRAVRHGDWKLIRYPHINHNQLFNLQADPDEQHNLAGDPQHTETLDQMLGLLAIQHADLEDPHPLTVPDPQPGDIPNVEFLQERLEQQRQNPPPRRNPRRQNTPPN